MPHRHDVAVRRIVATLALIAGTVAAVVAAIVTTLRAAGVPPDGARDVRPDMAIAGAELEPSPQPDLQRFLAEKQQRLQGTGWVDRSGAIAHIPIDTAMALVSERGLRAAAPSGDMAP